MTKIIIYIWVLLAVTMAARAQIATGDGYKLDQAVIAAGGGTSADAGNAYSLTGAIGQAITNTSSASPFTIRSGFFTAAPLVPTAATVTVSGRIISTVGRGVKNIVVTLSDSAGVLHLATTTEFGFYSFSDIEPVCS